MSRHLCDQCKESATESTHRCEYADRRRDGVYGACSTDLCRECADAGDGFCKTHDDDAHEPASTSPAPEARTLTRNETERTDP